MALKPEVLFQCLSDDISSAFGPDFVSSVKQFGPLWPGMSSQEASASSLLTAFLKKLERGRTQATDDAALVKFLSCNQASQEWQLRVDKIDSKLEVLLGEYKRAIDDFWFRDGYSLFSHPYEILENSEIGPGANIEARGGDFYTKFFSSKLSCSDISLYNWYSRYIQRFPIWAQAEKTRLETFGEPSITPSSRLSFVPKNDEISRCICIEPTLNTYFQLGIANILSNRLSERFGISLANQQFKNRNLARLGSLNDNLSTLDLSSASDSISTEMLRYSLPREFFSQLVKYRCASTDIRGRGTVQLGMISTMGNGYTFPLQVILFASMVVASLRFRGINPRSQADGERWGVNGDDIICPRKCTDDVLLLLDFLGFKVNRDKSFVEGPFRESCGHDYFKGVNVRGVYVKNLDTPSSRYAVFNQLTRFSTRTGILLPKTLSKLLTSVKFRPVPRWENFDAGLHWPLFSCRGSLSRYEPTQSYSYECLVPVPKCIRFTDDKVKVPRFAKPRIYNPDGLLISFLQRSINSGVIAVRVNSVLYRAKRRATASWDENTMMNGNPLSVPGSNDFGLDWDLWETIVSGLLEKES